MAKKSLEWSEGKIPIERDFREGIAHGDRLFSMSVHYTKLEAGNRNALYHHWHEELEFLFITKGILRFMVGKSNCIARPGDVLMIRPNQLHSAVTLSDHGVEFYAALIHYDFLAGMINDAVQQKYIRPLFFSEAGFLHHLPAETGRETGILPLLEEICTAYREEAPAYELHIKSMVWTLLYKTILWASEQPEPSAYDSVNMVRMKQAVRYIEQNYTQKISLEDIAGALHISVGHFCRLFGENTGATFVEYLNSYRVSEAARRIVGSDKRITDIALECGFGNINYFTTIFKRNFSCTPSIYRRRNQGHT